MAGFSTLRVISVFLHAAVAQCGYCKDGAKYFWTIQRRYENDYVVWTDGFAEDEPSAISAIYTTLIDIAEREKLKVYFDAEIAAQRLPYIEQQSADIPRLRALMLAAHPDRGGSSEEFITAREAYQAALRAKK